MVPRQRGEIRRDQALPRGFVLADFRPDRSAPDRGMDSGRQARRPFSASNAQVHLDTDPARSLSGATGTKSLDCDIAAGPVAERLGPGGCATGKISRWNSSFARGIGMVG